MIPAAERIRSDLRASLGQPDGEDVLHLGVAAELAGMHCLKIAGRLQAAYEAQAAPDALLIDDLRTRVATLGQALARWERAEAIRRGKAKMGEV